MTTTQRHIDSQPMENHMKRLCLLASLVALTLPALTLSGCNSSLDTVDQVQTNLVDKTLFQGEWWYAQTAVDVSGDEAFLTGLFEGYPAADMGLDTSGRLGDGWKGSYPIARIRWVIDQNLLYAYRTYELIDGGNDDGRDEDFRGQPIAVFAIEDHVDVRQDFNPITGETTNTRVEDTTDRRWYERTFMRVDWSRNLISTPFWGAGTVESTSFDVQEAGHDVLPESWRPQFVRVQDDPDYRFADEWAGEDPSTVHYMSFVTQSMLTPSAEECLGQIGICRSVVTTMRNAFLRVPPNHSYAAAVQSHREFDRFGVIRTTQRTYVRGGDNQEVLREYCDADADCGIGGACEPVEFAGAGGETVMRNVCVGGLTEDRGETDFLTFYRPRHNFFVQSLTDQQCRVDWECNGRFDDVPGTPGSVCDRAARRCTIPMRDREIREVTYTLNAGFPAHLVKAAYRSMGDWNEVFMRGWRATQGREVPSGPNVACQSANPTDYCFCGSADDVGDGTCLYRYDPFQTPDEAEAAGVVDPYECHIENTRGWADPDQPTSFDEYGEDAYHFEFVGDECMFTLESNACDLDPSADCQELGDIRYQFYNYIEHGAVFFGGVATPMVDPTNGEFIYSSVNMAAESIESMGTMAREFFPVLRNEPGANDEFVEGENIRQFYANQGNTENPISVVAGSAFNGFEVDVEGRPGISTDLRSVIMDRVRETLPRVEHLHGTEGRAHIFSDRMQRLAGTPLERQLLASMGQDGWDLASRTIDIDRLDPALSPTHEAVMARTSPFRPDHVIEPVESEFERRQRQFPSGVIFDPPFAPDVESARFVWWAEAFRDRSLEEATIRMQQKYLEGVMHHEVGHGVGLHHNFGGNFDRNQYHDAYFHRVVDDGESLAIPEIQDFDDPERGGDQSGFVVGDEITNYFNELRRVRDERSAQGIGRYTTSSVMEYHGDLGIIAGIGRYDVAATLYNHFDQVEVYDRDPRLETTSSLSDIHLSHVTPRSYMQYYTGGESCDVTDDCPYASDNPLMEGQAIFQRCIRNPRRSRLPTPCEGDTNCVCSAFDEDVLDYQARAATEYEFDQEYFSVPYLFCTNFRTNDISWCSTGDAGESFQEAVDHYRRQWEQSWPLSYNRRFRRFGPMRGGIYSGMFNTVKIFQHFYFRYFFEPGFREDLGPLGVNDTILAAADGMNWLTEIVTLPQAGSYQFDQDDNIYRLVDTQMSMPGTDMSVPLGQGYPMWSTYQDGFYGFNRVEQSGIFVDKYFALQGLAQRNWNLQFTLDERFFVNYYDFFQVEMTEFFGGLILDDPRWYAPRVEMDGDTPLITPLTWYRGTCRSPGTGNIEPCRGSQAEVYQGTALGDTSNEILRSWATVLALAQFPIYYDPSFEQRIAIFRSGTGDGFTIPDVQPDGDTTCGYLRTLDPAHGVCEREDADYVAYVASDSQEYIAVKIRSRLTYNLEEEQLGFALLSRLADARAELDTLEAIPSPSATQRARIAEVREAVQRDESFLIYLIDVQKQYGIFSANQF